MFDTFLDMIIGALIIAAFPVFCGWGFAYVVAVANERAMRKGGEK